MLVCLIFRPNNWTHKSGFRKSRRKVIVMEKEIHTYTITLYGPGYQYVFGKLPERIWQYIQTECGGNALAYLEKWGEDLPEDMQLWEGFPNVCNAFFAEERRSHGFLCYEASGCAGMDGAQIEVRDEDGNLVYSTEFMKDGSGYSAFPKDGKTRRQWALLLAGHPQFADKCDCWGKFDDWDWGNLLKAQPQLAKYKPEK